MAKPTSCLTRELAASGYVSAGSSRSSSMDSSKSCLSLASWAERSEETQHDCGGKTDAHPAALLDNTLSTAEHPPQRTGRPRNSANNFSFVRVEGGFGSPLEGEGHRGVPGGRSHAVAGCAQGQRQEHASDAPVTVRAGKTVKITFVSSKKEASGKVAEAEEAWNLSYVWMLSSNRHKIMAEAEEQRAAQAARRAALAQSRARATMRLCPHEAAAIAARKYSGHASTAAADMAAAATQPAVATAAAGPAATPQGAAAAAAPAHTAAPTPTAAAAAAPAPTAATAAPAVPMPPRKHRWLRRLLCSGAAAAAAWPPHIAGRAAGAAARKHPASPASTGTAADRAAAVAAAAATRSEAKWAARARAEAAKGARRDAMWASLAPAINCSNPWEPLVGQLLDAHWRLPVPSPCTALRLSRMQLAAC